MFWRSLPMEFSWHYERQMHMGFTFMLAKILQKLYGDDKEKLAAALQRHMEFFNCTPALSSFIGGIIASMEEKNANDEEFDTSSINTIKSALMGPLSDIGDSIILDTLRILAVGIGTSLAMQAIFWGRSCSCGYSMCRTSCCIIWVLSRAMSWARISLRRSRNPG